MVTYSRPLIWLLEADSQSGIEQVRVTLLEGWLYFKRIWREKLRGYKFSTFTPPSLLFLSSPWHSLAPKKLSLRQGYPSHLVCYLRAILIQHFITNSLCQGDAGNPPRLGAGNFVEPRFQEITGHLGGLPTACVPGYEHHLVGANSTDDVGLVLVDGQGLLVLSDLSKLLKLQ